MTPALQSLTPPLRTLQDGCIQVGNSSVSLELVIYAFKEGATAEEICLSYPTLNLPDVYSVLDYYLHYTDQVETYLREREKSAETLRTVVEKACPATDLRSRLLSNASAQE